MLYEQRLQRKFLIVQPMESLPAVGGFNQQLFASIAISLFCMIKYIQEKNKKE